jgi:putative transposase
MSLRQEWFSAAELATMAPLGLPAGKSSILAMADRLEWCRLDWVNTRWRKRAGRGGGVEFHYSVLPHITRIKLAIDLTEAAAPSSETEAKNARSRDEMWAWFETVPAKKKAEAQRRLDVLQAMRTLVGSGVKKVLAAQNVATAFKTSVNTLYTWETSVRGADLADWLPYLAPRHAGRSGYVECSDEAWDFLLADYLRPAKREFKACFDDLVKTAALHGWTIPSAKTLERRIKALPPQIVILKREGAEALKKTFPSQERDHSVFHALEALNADGHKWDVFVKYPDGTIGRPIMVGFQDIYSGMLLSWRFDRSETTEVIRLAFGDVVEKYGIPRLCWFDNGRAFASKKMTGGTNKRFRFKIKPEDPEGIMKTLGIEVRWATPYHGQAKPIERFWRNVAGRIAKDIRFDGAYCGPNPMAKPDDYASRAVPLDVFLKVATEGLAEENARLGRRSKVCQGRSFIDTFNESYAASAIRKATAAQRRLWLLAAEGITAGKADGSLSLMGNRYWSPFLVEHRQAKLMVRFDPQTLHQPVHVYRMDGAYLGAAECIEAAGFEDAEAAQTHARNKAVYVRSARQMADAEKRMTQAQAAKLLRVAEETAETPPETRVVRMITRAQAAVQAISEEEEDFDPRQNAVLEATAWMNRVRTGHPRLVTTTDGDD